MWTKEGATHRGKANPGGLVLDDIAPWGRSFDDYVRMFGLSSSELAECRFLGCADGPACFNAELTARGGRIVSTDPIYAFSPDHIGQKIAETYDIIMGSVRANPEAYLWDTYESPEVLGRLRLASMNTFLADLVPGRRHGRYLPLSLPHLPFADAAFDLALCSHLLFTYSEHLDFDFHLESVMEMARVAREARIFPLLTTDGRTSWHLEQLRAELQSRSYLTLIEKVAYQFQRGGNEMLRVRGPGAS